MEQVFQALIDRSRALLDLKTIRTILGYQRRPKYRARKKRSAEWEVAVERPTYDLTIFKLHCGKSHASRCSSWCSCSSPHCGRQYRRRAPHRARARMPGQYFTRGAVRPRLRGNAEETDATARFYLCARCRVQVLICSCCDHGNIYCERGCAAESRRTRQRAAGQRYQRSLRGRRNHAARARRYRAQQNKVTHHGSPAPPPDAATAVDGCGERRFTGTASTPYVLINNPSRASASPSPTAG
jgi:hypothetical protein